MLNNTNTLRWVDGLKSRTSITLHGNTARRERALIESGWRVSHYGNDGGLPFVTLVRV